MRKTGEAGNRTKELEPELKQLAPTNFEEEKGNNSLFRWYNWYNMNYKLSLVRTVTSGSRKWCAETVKM